MLERFLVELNQVSMMLRDASLSNGYIRLIVVTFFPVWGIRRLSGIINPLKHDFVKKWHKTWSYFHYTGLVLGSEVLFFIQFSWHVPKMKRMVIDQCSRQKKSIVIRYIAVRKAEISRYHGVSMEFSPRTSRPYGIEEFKGSGGKFLTVSVSFYQSGLLAVVISQLGYPR